LGKRKEQKFLPQPINLDNSGVAWISGTQIKVIEIVFDKLAHGGSADEIQARFPRLTRSQVNAALNYFRKHQDEFQPEIERRLQLINRLGVREADSPFQRRLEQLRKRMKDEG
jgi:uncharacterized protein (DUF433 family)